MFTSEVLTAVFRKFNSAERATISSADPSKYLRLDLFVGNAGWSAHWEVISDLPNDFEEMTQNGDVVFLEIDDLQRNWGFEMEVYDKDIYEDELQQRFEESFEPLLPGERHQEWDAEEEARRWEDDWYLD